MNKELKDRKEWIELQATLHFVEEKILGIMDMNGWMLHKELEEQVKDLLSDRHIILNKMFRLHVTEQEVMRFREVNDHLLDLTQRLYDGHSSLMDFLCVNHIESCYPGTVIQVESRLDVDEAAEVLHFDDDGDYDSKFEQMLDALAWTEDMEIRSFITNLGEKNPCLIILTTAPRGQKSVWTYRSSKTSWSATPSTTSARTKTIPYQICSGFSHTISDTRLRVRKNKKYKIMHRYKKLCIFVP